MRSYLIIADDFTGANDTGVQIRRRGIPVSVVFSAKELFSAVGFSGESGGSCVIDTESRFLSEAEAYQKIVSEMEALSQGKELSKGKALSPGKRLPFADYDHIIKKVDSTLRGNIGAETKALAQCCKPELIIFAPALPDLGRTTLNRIHRLNGTPVTRTELARDPKTPVKIDDVQKIMTDAFESEVTHIDLDTLRNRSDDLRRILAASRDSDSDPARAPVADGGSSLPRVFTFDAETNADLQNIARIVLAVKKRVLWVGSAGLADNLLSVEAPLPPVLAVVASLSQVTRGQVHFAEKQGAALVKVPLYAIIGDASNTGDSADKTVEKIAAETADKIIDEIAEEAAALLNEGRDVILLSSSTYSVEEYQKTEESARRAGLSSGEMGAFTQKLIGMIAVRVLGRAKVSGLFLSGGDTAISCFESAGAIGSSIITEIATGIPLMRLIGGGFHGLKVVTKAGGFGKEDAIFYALRKLKEAD